MDQTDDNGNSKNTRPNTNTNTPNPTQRKNQGISRIRFDYDPFGPIGSHRLVRARNEHSVVEFAYDALGQIISETVTHNGRQTTIAYEYDGNGNRLKTTLPNGQTQTNLYYGSGHLQHIALDDETIADIERDSLHQQA